MDKGTGIEIKYQLKLFGIFQHSIDYKMKLYSDIIVLSSNVLTSSSISYLK